MQTHDVVIGNIFADPNNPRNSFDEAKLKGLAESIALRGVQVPLIVVRIGEGYQIVDGHCRHEAASIIKRETVPCVVLDKAPSAAELLLIQLTIDAHRNGLSPMDRAEAMSSLLNLKKWSASDLAGQLCISKSAVTRATTLANAPAAIKLAVREGRLGESGAYAILRMTPEEQADYLKRAEAGELTRDDLNAKAKKKPGNDKRQTRVSCPLPDSTITLASSNKITLEFLIEELQQAITQCKKARQEGIDVSTLSRVMRDRAKQKKVLA